MAATSYIALLRAINVAGHQPVTMADLKSMLTKLGFDDPRSLLASGNLLFTAQGAARASAKLEETLQKETAKRLGLDTDFFVRTAGEWAEVVAANPFSAEAKRDPSHLVAVVLKDAPGKTALAALREAIVGRETIDLVGKQLYAYYPDGIGRSKLTIALLEKKLGTRGTGRNWNTVLKLAALAGAG